MEGNFCRVTGSIRHTNDRRNIMAFRVAPLTTANEITNHLLETYYVKLKLRQLKKKMVVFISQVLNVIFI
jgi:replication factor A2